MTKGHLPVEWYNKCLQYNIENYPLWWRKMAEQWGDCRYDNHFWMIGSSSYVFKTDGILWAMDPVWLLPGMLEELSDELIREMSRLRFIVFTHEHGDHFSPEAVCVLKDIPVKWVVPQYFEKWFLSTGVPRENCIFAKPGDELAFDGINITAYLGHHHYFGGTEGPESLMYTVKTSKKSLFFPADLRDFKREFIPEGNYDDVFLHMYLNRENGYAYPFDEYYKPLTEFAAALDTKRIYIGHLYGFQCGHPDLIWNFAHAGMLEDGLYCLRPDIEVTAPRIGGGYLL